MSESIIRKLIKDSNLSWKDKQDAEILLDLALKSKENQETREIIDVLGELYNDLKDPKIFTSEYLSSKYQDVILGVIKDYKLRVRKNDCILDFPEYMPLKFKELLSGLCKTGTTIETTKDGKIVFTPKDSDILEREVKHAEDDGSGYAPKGFQEIFSCYQNGDDMNIYLWS